MACMGGMMFLQLKAHLSIFNGAENFALIPPASGRGPPARRLPVKAPAGSDTNMSNDAVICSEPLTEATLPALLNRLPQV